MGTWISFEDIESWQLAREFCEEIETICNREGLKSEYSFKRPNQ